MSRAELGNAAHIPREGGMGTLSPTGLDTKPTGVPSQHRQDLAHPCSSCRAEDVPWFLTEPARPGLILGSKHAVELDYFTPIPKHSFEQRPTTTPAPP